MREPITSMRPVFSSKVVPVIVITDVDHAVPMAHALLEGGIDVMEITLRSDVALDAIEAVARAVPPWSSRVASATDSLVFQGPR